MINFCIFEIQTDKENNSTFLAPVTFDNEDSAWSAYYSKLSFAIMSNVYIHTVMLCTIDGRLIDSKCYMHNVNGGA